MVDIKCEDEMTDRDRMFMWYTIALQALFELGRPLLLNVEFVEEIVAGKWEVFGSRTDDGSYLYQVQERKIEDVQAGDSGKPTLQ